MTQEVKEMIEGLVDAFEKKDLEASLSFFAEDAVLFDPHYPVPKMEGIGAIRQGLEWGLGNMEKPGISIRHFWMDGANGAIETDTHHVFKGGMELKFDQVFIFETQDGKITRMQAYVPYPPPGIGGLLTKLTKLGWKLKGKA